MTTVFIDGVQYVPIGSNQPPVEPPIPPITPPVTPPAQPPAGWSAVMDPLSNVQSAITVYGQRFNISNGQYLAFSVQPNVINAHRIWIDPSIFQVNGVQISTNQFNTNIEPRDMVISTAPGLLTPISPTAFRQGIDGAYLFVNTSASAYGMVVLQPNVEYWLNVKASQPNVAMDYIIYVQSL